MRWLLLTLLFSGAAMAQESPESSPIREVSPTAPPPAPTVATSRPSLPLGMEDRWHKARVVYGVGAAMGFIGSGLTLASVVLVAVTDYPCDPYDPMHATNPNACNPNKPPRPTDPAPLLAYIGSSASALGFVLSASGLGYEHHLLDEMGADTGRGFFAGGTALGVIGFAGVGASYLFGLTDIFSNPHDQGVAILTSSIGGALLCAVGGILYSVDSSRVTRAWARLTTF